MRLLQNLSCVFLLACGPALAGIVTTVNTTWGTSDTNLGITGLAIVDFETTSLPHDLGISFSRSLGSGTWNSGIGGNLPFVVSTADDTTGLDAFGPTYGGGAWDGTHYLVNVPQIPITSYAGSFGWGNITLTFANGTNAVGFSLQQADSSDIFLINGSPVTNVDTAFGQSNGYRQGYILFTATGNTVINTLEIQSFTDGVNTDGWAIDHLAYSASADPPEPGTFALGGLILAAVTLARRARHNR